MRKEHALDKIIKKVDETHPGLGNLVAFECIAVKARKLVLAVAPAGCGKSVASNLVGKQSKNSIITDRLSTAGLQGMKEDLTDFDGVVVVDDIAKTGTGYARVATVTTLAELVYSHYISSHLAKLQYEITNFNGSAICNIQPVLLKLLVGSPEWEASVQDKAIRYYHLYRPINPVMKPPECSIDWGGDFEKVPAPNLETKTGKELIDRVRVQWGRGRSLQHVSDLLRSAAAIDNRKKVGPTDFRILNQLINPVRVESMVIDKAGFESDRELRDERLAILTQFMSYGAFTLENVAEDFHMSQTTAYRCMDEQRGDWVIVGKYPTVYAPSQRMLKAMRDIGLVSENGTGPKGAK